MHKRVCSVINAGMIIGIGNDLIDISRIAKMLDDHGERFVNRCFTVSEQQRANKHLKKGNQDGYVATFAKRFAAKEACSKALGTGIAQDVFMKDIGVVNDDLGNPSIKLSGGALEKLHDITPAGHRAVVHLSLTDEPPLAQAYVIIEAVKIQS